MGQVLVIVALAALTYAIIDAGRIGFGAAQIVALLVLALGCFAALVLYELRRREPLLEVRFFTSAPFAGAEGERGRLNWGHGPRSPSCRFHLLRNLRTACDPNSS